MSSRRVFTKPRTTCGHWHSELVRPRQRLSHVLIVNAHNFSARTEGRAPGQKRGAHRSRIEFSGRVLETTMDPATLAATAIAATLPYITALGKEAAESAASAAGKSIWEWVKGKLTSAAGQEVVEDLQSGPEDAD